MQIDKLDSEFLKYLATHHLAVGEKMPTLAEIGQEMGISLGKLREQLEYARRLGLVSVRPRVGTRREPFDFLPAILPSLLFSLATGEATFAQFAALRRTIEASMWHEAVTRLLPQDLQELRQILAQAWGKLRQEPVHVPKDEHRAFHLTIFKRLENPFVQGILSAYWEAYEASELTRLADYSYWLTVWRYHEQVVEMLEAGDFDRGLEVMLAHFALLPVVSMPA